jgi:hypothetical protein
VTIDRLRAGELGVKEDGIVTDESELLEKAKQHLESVNETSKCKEFRRKIMEKLSPSTYVAWFTKVEFFEEGQGIAAKFYSRFVEDYVRLNFGEVLGV